MVDPHERTSPPVTAATFHAWWITILLLVSMTVNFMDRLVLGAVAPTLQSTLHFSSTQYSYVVFAFTLGMTLGSFLPGRSLTGSDFAPPCPRCSQAGHLPTRSKPWAEP